MNENINISIQNATKYLTKTNEARHGFSLNRSGLKEQVVKLINLLRCAMWPDIFGTEPVNPKFIQTIISSYLQQASILLNDIISAVLNCSEDSKCDADKLTCEFIESIAEISEYLQTDIRAAYEGDPAARSEDEIMLAYPAFEAISIYRLAHKLYELKVPLLPRMMTEYAHQMTGIDIHPGAKIGKYFFIDHGTGVVIGETCVIGEHVKLYQGVTLGARSFELDEKGNPVKGTKRHPDIGNRVIIYAGATILGGNTVIGDDCVIGGNVWLTSSVEAGKKVYYDGGSITKL
ncbi:MAG: serine acetyltransferase [Papillibacter sp.]|jgi:serine O-acetyltransferase|nr:serine acetyltransferase [Papillibacter sp.]